MGRNVKVTDTAQKKAADLEPVLDEDGNEVDPQLTDNPQESPGADFLTGDGRGPFLDTGLKVGRGKARYGAHIYLSLMHLAPVLREAGWLTADDAEEMVERNAELEERNAHLEKRERAYEGLLDAISEHFEPEVVERVVTRDVARAPSDHDIVLFLKRHPDHPVLQAHGEPALGTPAQYAQVYTGHGYISGDVTSRPSPGVGEATSDEQDVREGTTQPVNKLDPEGSVTKSEHDEAYPDNVPTHFELQGQKVDLDDVLSGSGKDIVAYADGHGEEFALALARRERALGELKGGNHPRKNVIEGLGFDYDEFLATGGETPEEETEADLEPGMWVSWEDEDAAEGVAYGELLEIDEDEEEATVQPEDTEDEDEQVIVPLELLTVAATDEEE